MLTINELSRLYLGVKGENNSRTIEIDMSAWASIYPNATAVILHKRSGDQAKELTGATYDSETKVLQWKTSSTDTFYDGFGVAEIRMVENSVVKKSKDMITTVTASSITTASGDVLESNYQAFLNAVTAQATAAGTAKTGAETAQGYAEAAQAAAEAAILLGPYVDETTGNWFVWDWDDEEYKDTGVHAQGPAGADGSNGQDGQDGADGFSPTASVTKSGKVATITITDKNGTTTETVSDGEDADPTTIIDDTAGDGATNKVWSADKSYDEKTTLLNAINGKVSDVQVNGTSVVSSGTANIPVMTSQQFGVAKLGSGLTVNASNQLHINKALDDAIKLGSNEYQPIVPVKQHISTFYGLAKASGDSTQASSSNPVGTYTADAKTAIKSMLGVTDPTVTDVQINGTSILSSGVANVPIANANNIYGVVLLNDAYGIATNNDGRLFINAPSDAMVKDGDSAYRPIVPKKQHQSVFYGLAKASGDTTQSASSNAVGVYTPEAKRKITDMIEPQFRLIKEITITEDASYVYVNTDSNGDPFALSEIIMLFTEMTSNNNGGTGSVIFNKGKNQATANDPYIFIANLYMTSEMSRIVHAEVKGGNFFAEASADNLTQGYTRTNIATSKNAMGIISCNKFSEIFIYSPNAYKFTAGTIKIIGR